MTQPKPKPAAENTDQHGRKPGHELYGEPLVERVKVVRLPPLRATPVFPMVEEQRRREAQGLPALDLEAEAKARKFSPARDARPGDVPVAGTPRGNATNRTDGSILPVVAASRSIPDLGDQWSQLVEEGKILPPPYDPWLLVCQVDESDTLPQCVEAMAVNIGGHGYELEALFDTRDPTTGAELTPPAEAKAERETLELWLAACNVELGGLTGLMDLVDRDTETVGYGTMEVLRDMEGREASVGHVPSYTIRLGPEHRPILVNQQIRHPTTGKLVTVPRWRRFRLFCQVKEGRIVWFKAYGDPRHVNWRTGQIRSQEQGPWPVDGNGNSQEATELAYVRRYHPATPYGVPIWLGAVPHVRASRSASELLVDWFDNAPIGVKLAMIAGGRWKDGQMEYIGQQLNHGARGMANAWTVLPLEGDVGAGGDRDMLEETRDSPARMTLEDLSTELPSELYYGRDSLIDRSAYRTRAMFRLGAIYYGDSEAESNRAAADTSRAIGEEQVLKPIRRSRWETLINDQLLPAMGINMWRVKIKGATTSDNTEGTAKALPGIVTGGGASPNTLAKLYSDMSGQPVELIAEPWGDRPLTLTMALLAQGLDPNLPLSELAAQAAAKAEEARAMAAQIAGGGGGEDEDTDTDTEDAEPELEPGKAPPKGKGPPKPGSKATKSLAARVALGMGASRELLELRSNLVEQLRAEGGDELAAQLDELPTAWTDRG